MEKFRDQWPKHGMIEQIFRMLFAICYLIDHDTEWNQWSKKSQDETSIDAEHIPYIMLSWVHINMWDKVN